MKPIDQATLEKLCPWVQREAVLTRERDAALAKVEMAEALNPDALNVGEVEKARDRALARVNELEAARVAYASEFDGDVGNIHARIRALKVKAAELESADIVAKYAIRALGTAGQEIEQRKTNTSPSVWQQLTDSWRNVATQAMRDRNDTMAMVLRVEADKHNLTCNLDEARTQIEQLKSDRDAAATDAVDGWSAKVENLTKYVAELETSEKNISNAYLRVRALLGAFDTQPGGSDRFEVTENAIRALQFDLTSSRAAVENLNREIKWKDEYIAALKARKVKLPPRQGPDEYGNFNYDEAGLIKAFSAAGVEVES